MTTFVPAYFRSLDPSTYGIVYSNGNRTLTKTTASVVTPAYSLAYIDVPVNGVNPNAPNLYWEIVLDSVGNNHDANKTRIGLDSYYDSQSYTELTGSGSYSMAWAADGTYYEEGSNSSGPSFGEGDILGILVDSKNNQIKFFVNGVLSHTRTPNYFPASFDATISMYSIGVQFTLKTDWDELTYPPVDEHRPGLAQDNYNAIGFIQQIVPESNKIYLEMGAPIHSLSTPVGDLLVFFRMDASSGVTGFDCTALFDELDHYDKRYFCELTTYGGAPLRFTWLDFDPVAEVATGVFTLLNIQALEANNNTFTFYFDKRQLPSTGARGWDADAVPGSKIPVSLQDVCRDTFQHVIPYMGKIRKISTTESNSLLSAFWGTLTDTSYTSDSEVAQHLITFNGTSDAMEVDWVSTLNPFQAGYGIDFYGSIPASGTHTIYAFMFNKEGWHINVVDGIVTATIGARDTVFEMVESLPTSGEFLLSLYFTATTVMPYINGVAQTVVTLDNLPPINIANELYYGGLEDRNGEPTDNMFGGTVRYVCFQYNQIDTNTPTRVLALYKSLANTLITYDKLTLVSYIDPTATFAFGCEVEGRQLKNIHSIPVNFELSATVSLITISGVEPIFINGAFALSASFSTFNESEISLETHFAFSAEVDAASDSIVALDTTFAFGHVTELTNLLPLPDWATWRDNLPAEWALSNNDLTATSLVDTGSVLSGTGACTKDKIYFEVVLDNWVYRESHGLSAFLPNQPPTYDYYTLSQGFPGLFHINEWTMIRYYPWGSGSYYEQHYTSGPHDGCVMGISVDAETGEAWISTNGVYSPEVTPIVSLAQFFVAEPDNFMTAGCRTQDIGAVFTLRSDPADMTGEPYDGTYTKGLRGPQQNGVINVASGFEFSTVMEIETIGLGPAINIDGPHFGFSTITEIESDYSPIDSVVNFAFSCSVTDRGTEDHARWLVKPFNFYFQNPAAFSNDGRTIGVRGSNDYLHVLDFVPSTGKVYIEIVFDAEPTIIDSGITPTKNLVFVGIEDIQLSPTYGWDTLNFGELRQAVSYWCTGQIWDRDSLLGQAASWNDGYSYTIMIAIDTTTGQVWFGLNDFWQGGGTPWLGTNEHGIIPITDGKYTVGVSNSNTLYLTGWTCLTFPQAHSYNPPTGFVADGFMFPYATTPRDEFPDLGTVAIFALGTEVHLSEVQNVEWASFDPESYPEGIFSNNNRTVEAPFNSNGVLFLGQPITENQLAYFEFESIDLDPFVLNPAYNVSVDLNLTADWLAEYNSNYTRAIHDLDNSLSPYDYLYSNHCMDGQRIGVIIDGVLDRGWVLIGDKHGQWIDFATGSGFTFPEVVGGHVRIPIGSEYQVTVFTDPRDFLYKPPSHILPGLKVIPGSLVALHAIFALGCEVETTSTAFMSINANFELSVDSTGFREPFYTLESNFIFEAQVIARYSTTFHINAMFQLDAVLESKMSKIALESAFVLDCSIESWYITQVSVDANFELLCGLDVLGPQALFNINTDFELRARVDNFNTAVNNIDVRLGLISDVTMVNLNQDITIDADFILANEVAFERTSQECHLPVYNTNRWT